jgi:hypothetical protein
VLKITIPGVESFDEFKNEFIMSDEVHLELEHSLASLSKWESVWEKPFLSSEEKSVEETVSYVRDMVLTPDVPDEVFNQLTNDNLKEINAYIAKKMTATWFNERGPKKPNTKTITSELLYYWMVAHSIPFECQYWHLNRLLTLIRVCNEENAPEEKVSESDMIAERRRLNEERRKQFGTQG